MGIVSSIASRAVGARPRATAVASLLAPRMRVCMSSPDVVRPRASGGPSGGASRPPTRPWTSRSLKHTSALVMIPPRAVWEAVQEVRCVRDKSYLRWMPHVNLLYPFLEDDPSGETFADAAAIAADALKETAPFRCSLSAFAFFQHARSATVWLHPAECAGVDEEWARLNTRSASDDARDGDGNEDEPCDVASNSNALEPGPPACPPASRGLVAAQRNLEAAFPFANHLSTISKAGFVPHVSVGQWPDAVSASAAVANLHASWRPLEFDVDAVFLISRPSDGSGPFQVRARVPLGGGEPEVFNKEGDATRRDVEWYREPYAPRAPPLGARCLVPKPKRGRGARRGRGSAKKDKDEGA